MWDLAWAGTPGPWPWFSSFLKTLPKLFFLPRVSLHLPQEPGLCRVWLHLPPPALPSVLQGLVSAADKAPDPSLAPGENKK